MGKAGGLKEIKLHHRRPRRVFVQIAFIASIVWVFYHTLSSLGGENYLIGDQLQLQRIVLNYYREIIP
jgi:hypothetical protein